MASPVLQFKRGVAANVGLASFKAGEPGFTTDRYDFYIGLDATSANQKFFGSARYWNRETSTVGSSVRVVEGSNNGNNFIALKSPDSLSADTTYTLPVGVSTAGYLLQNDGTGTLNWVPVSSTGAISGFTIRDEGIVVGTAGSVSSIDFVGNGIVATASGTASTITISTASTTTIGVASFNSTDFFVNAGAVGINTESIQDMVGSAISAGITTNVTLTYNDANNRIDANVNTATTSVLGVASFNSANFTVAAGAVSLASNAVGLGTNTVGQYAKSITSGSGLSGTAAAADDGTDYTIDVNTGAGITITSDAVAFKNAASLSNNTLMKYDTSNSQLTNSIITDNGTTATVTGGLTVTGTLTGTASTATLANTVVTTTAPSGTYYPGFFVSGTGVAATSVYVDTGISYVSNTDTLTATNLTVTGTLTGTASTATRATTIDVTTAPNGVYYPALVNTTNANGATVYADTGLYYIAQTDTLYVNGNVSIGGTSGTLFATNLFINDKDIVVGYTTDLSGNDASKDSTSTHGGIAVASTTGSPLFNMPQVAGINSLPFTYKQFMWIAQGTSGYTGMGTDAWVSNYPIAIGTVTVQNNSRFTVGAGYTFYDTYLDATAVDLRVKNINASGITTSANVNVLTGGSYQINGTSVLNATTLGSGVVNSSLTSVGTLGQLNVTGVTTSGGVNLTTGNSYQINGTSVLNATTLGSGVVNSSLTSVGTLGQLNVSGVSTFSGIATYTAAIFGTNATFTGIVTATTFSGTASTATRATTADVTATNVQTGGLVFATAGTGATLYNDADLTYDSNANRLTAVNVTASTEVRTAAVKAADGTAAITIASSTGAVGVASDLTVSGNLFVAGSSTQVNTTSLQVEDRVIELGKVQGTPPADTTWDLGILFNYYTASSNKKSSVYWESGAQRFLFASDVTESVLGINLPDTGAVGLGTTTPQLASPTFAPIEVGELWVNNSCTGGSQRIVGCTGGTLILENITIDAGTF